MNGIPTLHQTLTYIQTSISLLGVLLILTGVLIATYHYILHFFNQSEVKAKSNPYLNRIRLNLSRTLFLGLEFIVAADLIGTTTAPDYYTIGIVAAIVLIRTLLSFSLNKEIKDLAEEEKASP